LEQFSFSDFLLLWSESPASLGNRPAGPGGLTAAPSPGQRNHSPDGHPSCPGHCEAVAGALIHLETSMRRPATAQSNGASNLVSEGEQGAAEMPDNQAKINWGEKKEKMSRGTKCCAVPYLSWQPLRASL